MHQRPAPTVIRGPLQKCRRETSTYRLSSRLTPGHVCNVTAGAGTGDARFPGHGHKHRHAFQNQRVPVARETDDPTRFSATCKGPRRCTVISSPPGPGPACERCIPAPTTLGPLLRLLERRLVCTESVRRRQWCDSETATAKAGMRGSHAYYNSVWTMSLGCFATGAEGSRGGLTAFLCCRRTTKIGSSAKQCSRLLNQSTHVHMHTHPSAIIHDPVWSEAWLQLWTRKELQLTHSSCALGRESRTALQLFLDLCAKSSFVAYCDVKGNFR
jgi:hypothetical protein